MRTLKILVFLPFAMLSLSAMETTTTKGEPERGNWEKFELSPSIPFLKRVPDKRDLRLVCNVEKKIFNFQREEESFWKGWELKTFGYEMCKVSPEDQLIDMKPLGLVRVSENSFFGAVIATYLTKVGENFKKNEKCVLAKLDEVTRQPRSMMYSFEGKISRVKFAITQKNPKIKIAFYTHTSQGLDKLEAVLDFETFSDVKKLAIIKQWKKIQE